MDIKNILSKIEDCKKETQKKELLKNFKLQISKSKTPKILEQLSKLNYEKTLNKLYKNKDFDNFLEILTSIIEYIPSLAETYRQKYQEIMLNIILPNNLIGEEMINNYFHYFLIATNNLDDVNNIKYKEYLIYFLFFEIFLKLKLNIKIIELFIKLEQYITKSQYELIIYILTIYSYANKTDDFPEEMVTLKKIIDFCKFDFSKNNFIFSYNYNIMKNIVRMLLLYTPFKQEILINIYNSDQNFFINMIQDIIINDLNEVNINKNNTELININNFFDVKIDDEDFKALNNNSNNKILNHYFSNKEYFRKKFFKFIENMNLKEIYVKNKIDIYKGILWTLSSLILKSYYSSNKNDIDESSNDFSFDENKNHCSRLFNSLISLFQFMNLEQQKFLVKQFLELIKSLLKQVKLFEDWNYILDLLSKCTNIIINTNNTENNRENEFKTEINIMNEIFILILNMYNNNNLTYCDMEYLSSIIHKCNQFLNNDNLLCFYISIYLINEHQNKKYIIKSEPDSYDKIYINFLNNIEILLFNIFTLSHKNFTNAKNYLLELIRVNYLNDKIKNQENDNINKKDFISKRIIIERVLEKYLENIFISFGDEAQNYSFFNYVLIEILCQSINIDFMNQILTLLIFNSNEKINKNLYDNFVISIMNNLFENLINNSTKCLLSKEKLSVLIDFLFDENNMNDENIFKIGLSLLKCFIVNNQNEIIFINSNNKNDINEININEKHSMLVIDYMYNKILSKKPTFNDEKEYELFHKNFYSPYILLPHIQLFKSINQNMDNDITKSYLMESILELYYICFSGNLSFIKNVDLNKFFNLIFEEKELTKISSSKKVTSYIIKIIGCLPYQLSNDIMFNSSQKIALNIKKNSRMINDMQLIVEPKYKICIINFLINFWSKLNLVISKTINKIFNNEQLSQSIFNNNNEKAYLNERQIKLAMHNFMNKGDSHIWCGELNLYTQFDYLYNCIKLLKLYIMSSMNDIQNLNSNNNLSQQNNTQKINRSRNFTKFTFSPFKSIIQKIIIQIFNSMNYKYFNKKYAYFILSFLYDIKELLPHLMSEEFITEINNQNKKSFSYSNIHEQYTKSMLLNNKNIFNEKEETTGINIIYKIIFISLFLSWNKEEKIISLFDKYFKTNYKSRYLLKDKFLILSKFYDEKNNFEEGLKNIIQHLGDILNLYLMEYIPEHKINIMINFFDEIFPKYNNTYREYYFNKMIEWNLKIRKNRDNMNIDYKNIFDKNFLNNINNNLLEDNNIGQKVLKNSFVFYGNNSLIVMNPININKYSFTLRNPICNINLMFDTNVPIINTNNTFIKKENSNESNENEEEEEDDDENSSKKNKNEENYEDSSYYLSSDSNELNNSDEDLIPSFHKTEINKKNKINDKNNNKKVKIFEFEEVTEDIKPKRKNSDDNMDNNKYEINNNLNNNNRYRSRKSKEFDEKIMLKNNNIYPMRRKRFNTDFGDKFKKSLILAEKKIMMKNCLKIFSLMTELTDYKIEKYKWFDITKKNNLYKITKLIQNLDILPLYYTHNCGFIYYSELNNNPENIATYMFFLQKLGLLYDYYDIYPDLINKNNKVKNMNKESDKYIIINQDSFSRINFNILNLVEKNEKKLIEENNIIFVWMDDNNKIKEYSINNNIEQNKFKIFFIITKINNQLYKIQRKYNSDKKTDISNIIDELYFNDIFIDLDSQNSVQLLINMIINIDVMIKIYNKEESNDKNKKSIVDKNIKTEKYMNIYLRNSGKSMDKIENNIDENYLMNENISSLQKRFELINKL